MNLFMLDFNAIVIKTYLQPKKGSFSYYENSRAVAF